MIYTYIKKDTPNIYVELGFLLDENYKTGITWEDYLNNAWVLLTEKQLDFRKNNPESSVKEVFDMKTIVPSDEELLNAAKRSKIQQILEQDRKSNIFYIKTGDINVSMWLDKNTRNSLLNVTIPTSKATGDQSIVLWHEGDIYNNISPVSVTVPIQWAEDNIKILETYAKLTFDLLNSNLSLVMNSTTVEEVVRIDITLGYPKPLIFDIFY